LLKNLKFHSSFGVDYNNYEENEYWDTRTILGASGGKGTQSITQSGTIINEQTLSYNTNIGQHKISELVVNTLQHITLKNVYATGTISHNTYYEKICTESTKTGSNFSTNSNVASVFSRIDYNYAGNYYAEFTVRADGSSRFGANHKWGYFPAVGA